MSVRYDALAVKARSMYGRRVRREDLIRITQRHTIEDIADDLRQLPGWSEATASIPTGELLTRATLESALRDQVHKEGDRLAAFAAREDRALLEFPVRRTELEHILAALRRLHASMFKDSPSMNSPWLRRTRLDTDALRKCGDFAGLAQAARETIYSPALAALITEEGTLPNYGATEALLWSVYFKHLMELGCKRYKGDVKKMVEGSVGRQMDLMNILHALRLQNFFPDSGYSIPVLVPYHYKVKPDRIQAICTAPTREAAMALVEETPYAPVFRDAKVEELQDLYRNALYAYSRRQLVMGKPSVYSAIAYLNLRELEVTAVVAAVEASKYQLSLNPSFLQFLDD